MLPTKNSVSPLFIPHFEQCVESMGDAHALYFEQNVLTYDALNQRANQLARFLLEEIGSEAERVGLLFSRHPDCIVAIIACLKAGIAYIPLDVENNSEQHLMDMVEISKPSLILTHQTLQSQASLLHHTKTICMDDPAIITRRNSYPSENLCKESINEKTLAYIIFSSGTTSQPKGVKITHQGLLNCANSLNECLFRENKQDFYVTSESRIAGFVSFKFDAFLYDVMMALRHGACLYLISETVRRDFQQLKKYFTDHEITHAVLLPTVVKTFDEAALASLKVLLVMGEAFSRALYDELKQIENLIIINGYGPTEATICSTLNICSDEDIGIGQARSGIQLAIRAEQGQIFPLKNDTTPAQIDCVGELLIAGDIAEGYCYDESNEAMRALNQKKFHDDLYETADQCQATWNPALCRWQLEFLGRLDNQLKIRGQLLCLEEIEDTAMKILEKEPFRQYFSIKEGERVIIQVAVGDQQGSVAIYATLVISSDQLFQDLQGSIKLEFFETLQQELSVVLEPFKVPRFWRLKNHLALTGNSKSDRFIASEQQSEFFIITKGVDDDLSIEEEKIDAIWKQALPHLSNERISSEDHFFQVGGDSMSLSAVLSELKKTNPDLNFSILLRHLTLSSMALLLKPLIEVNLQPLNQCAESSTVDPVFFIHSILGDAESDYHALVSAFGYSRPIYGINAVGLVDASSMAECIEDIARPYVIAIWRKIEAQYQESSIWIVGWSAGGVIAYEIVKQLQALASPYNLSAEKFDIHLIMLDTQCPSFTLTISPEQYASRFLRMVDSEAFRKKTAGVLLVQDGFGQYRHQFDFRSLVIQAKQGMRRLLQLYGPPSIPSAVKDFCETIRKTQHALIRYKVLPIKNTVLVTMTHSHEQAYHDSDKELLGWPEKLINHVYPFDGDHFSVLEKPKKLAKLINSIIVSRQLTNLLPQNLHFSGRENYLKEIQEKFSLGISTIRHQQTLCGLGGIGKTELALAYAYQALPHQYTFVRWIHASSENKESSIDSFCRALGMRDERLSFEEKVKFVVRKIKLIPKWLLIFDNADDQKSLQSVLDLFTQLKPGQDILITSRSQHWYGMETIRLDVFSAKEAYDYIRQQYPKVSFEQANQLANMLGCLPLALKYAMAYCQERCRSIEGYISIYQNEGIRLLGQRLLQTHRYEDRVLIVSKLSFDQLTENTKRMLCFCVFLSPYTISKDIFINLFPDVLIVDEAIAGLRLYSLIDPVDDSTIKIHPLLQEVIQSFLTDAEKLQYLSDLIQVLDEMTPWFMHQMNHALVVKALDPHVILLKQHLERLPAISVEPRLRALILQLEAYYRALVRFEVRRAIDQLEQAKALLLPVHDFTLTKNYFTLALLCSNTDDLFEKAKGYFNSTLRYFDRPELTKSESIAKLVILYSIAIRHKSFLSEQQAIQYLEEALNLQQDLRVLFREGSLRLEIMSSLFILYKETHQSQKARDIYQAIDRLLVETPINQIPISGAPCRGLIPILLERGDFQSAISLLERILYFEKMCYGKVSDRLIPTLHELAGVWHEKGDYEKEINCLKEVVNCARTSSNGAVLSNAFCVLMDVYREQGKIAESQQVLQRLQEHCQATDNNIFSLINLARFEAFENKNYKKSQLNLEAAMRISSNNIFLKMEIKAMMAGISYRQKKYKKFRAQFTQVATEWMNIQRECRSVGYSQCFDGVIKFYMKLGLYDINIKICEKFMVLHPDDFFIVAKLLVDCYFQEERYVDAIDFLCSLRQKITATHSADSIALLPVLKDLAYAYKKQGLLKESEKILKEAIYIGVKYHGENHVQVKKLFSHLIWLKQMQKKATHQSKLKQNLIFFQHKVYVKPENPTVRIDLCLMKSSG